MCLGKTYTSEEAKIFGSNSFTLPALTRKSLGFTDVDKIWFQDFLVGQFTIPALIRYLKPKLVISLYDGGPLVKQLKSVRDLPVRFIPYFPIDSEFSIINKIILECSSILTMSEHSKKIMIDQGAKDVTVIPHIILPKVEQVEQVEQVNYDRIIVGTVNANHSRKRLNLVVEAFINIYNQGKKVGLLIKTTPASNEKFSTHWCKSYDIESLKNYIKMKCKDIDMSTVRFITKVLSDEELRLIYSEIDIFIHASSGEGFGLTPLEAILIGDCLPIVANNTSMPYLFGSDYFGLVKCKLYPYYHNNSQSAYKCIMKCYVSSKFSIKYRHLNISRFNTIIVIDPSGYQLEEAFKTPSKIRFDKYKPTEIIHLKNLQDLLNNVELFSNIFPFFQVLILDTQKFISEQLEMKILGNEDKAKEIWRIRKAFKADLHMCTYEDITDKITSRDGICAIPIMEDIMTKINILFNMDNKDETLTRLKSRISSICDVDMIIERLSIFIRSKMI
uniref:Glycosyltransferase n=1 Tax=Pithovirus LCPAC406 TaxID=2506599 RepID=A0A481ZCR2_9VIRU|nr:MAG: glycosyltransferase [Pithovirus LCPAC406]